MGLSLCLRCTLVDRHRLSICERDALEAWLSVGESGDFVTQGTLGNI